ncbi:MAG: Lrp/AsnC family transcriptional regulator [Caldimicrobium sp.]|jgi:DNA-binding Lrp family transcriptional regulator
MVLEKNLEKELIKLIQRKFPLVPRPFKVLAESLNIEEEKILKILRKWQKEGILRQISAIFNPSFFGHTSSLFAFKISEDNLSQAIEVINSHPGVSHNYLRNHEFNLWFTLVVPPEKILMEEAKVLFIKSGAKDYLYLPIIKVFKIAAIFNFEDKNSEEISEEIYQGENLYNFTERDIEFVKILQTPLPLVSEPFKEFAKLLSCKEEEIFEWLLRMKEKGGLRRYAGLFKHQRLGFKKNVMVAWKVSAERIEEVGKAVSKYSFITHCYLRRSYPHWPYNIYTMCHFKEREKMEEIAHELGLKDYLALETVKELKKIRLQLFYN